MERVVTSVIPALVEDGVFGKVQFVNLKPDNGETGAQFASCLEFVNLTVKGSSGEEVIPLVIKVIMEDRIDDTSVQFQTELLMYNEILPALGFDTKSYPTLFHGKATDEETYIIFENLKKKNFRNSISNPFLDFDHISLALKKIAKLHALSYILKQRNEAKFIELTGMLKPLLRTAEQQPSIKLQNFAAIERGVFAFEKKNGSEELMEDFLNALKNPQKVRDELSKPVEPFGVICHGDFNNNNVMYKYDENGCPIDCVFFDFQLSKYGSPAAELSFYLCMQTDAETREALWEDFLTIYWETLKKSVPDQIRLPSYEEFLGHFASRVAFGYSVCSFFLPMMIDRDIPYWLNLSLEEQILLNQTMAGEEGEKKLVDVLDHMFNMKYIHAFVDYAKANNLLR